MSGRFYLPFGTGLDDVLGRAVPGGKINFFDNDDHESVKDTYSDAALLTVNANPVVANSAGRFPRIFLADGLYFVRFTDADDVEIYTEEDVDGVSGLDGDAFLQIAEDLADVADAAASLANLGGVADTRQVIAGSGLSGGGTLAADRTFDVEFASQAEVEAGTEAEVHVGTDSAELDFPLGHTVWVTTNIGGGVDLNKADVIYLHISLADRYTTASGGDMLLGTWHSRGGDAGGSGALMQRVA
jgi:hypothetical protein